MLKSFLTYFAKKHYLIEPLDCHLDWQTTASIALLWAL